eukprot:6191133-Pleurochrysis_carterae.AAC.3
MKDASSATLHSAVVTNTVAGVFAIASYGLLGRVAAVAAAGFVASADLGHANVSVTAVRNNKAVWVHAGALAGAVAGADAPHVVVGVVGALGAVTFVYAVATVSVSLLDRCGGDARR